MLLVRLKETGPVILSGDAVHLRLKDKIVVVTAAGQGIGRASAIAMAAEGATVWATDLNEKALRSLAAVADIRTVKLDVLDHDAIVAFFDRLPTIDVLFN